MIPKLMYPTYNIVVPSTKKAAKFRPFLVREEKILLMAASSEDDNDILTAVKQVVESCNMDDLDINALTIFDLEYIFLKIRANSVDNIVEVSYIDSEDEKTYDFKVDLNKIEIEVPKKVDFKIQINDNAGVMMKYPSASVYDNKKIMGSDDEDTDSYYKYIAKCIDKIFVDEEVIDASTISDEDLFDFVESMDVKSFGKVEEFMGNVPSLKHTIEYKNSLGNDRKIELRSLNDFFTLR